MGQPNYCCASGQSCAWDDAGKVACCASGTNCQGSAGGGAYAGNGAGSAQAGQYYTPTSSWNQQQQTTTVYQSQSEDCNCESTPAQNVVPIVPVTIATIATPYVPSTTSYYVPPTSTYYPYTTSTTPAAVAEAPANTECPQGYSTAREANVGAPVRTVGCYVIINSGALKDRKVEIELLWFWSFAGIVGVLWL